MKEWNLKSQSEIYLLLWLLYFNGIVSDFNIVFLTLSFYDTDQKILKKKKKKMLFPKFQLIPILHLQVMHDLVHWHCPKDYWVKREMYFFRGELQKDAKKYKFRNF